MSVDLHGPPVQDRDPPQPSQWSLTHRSRASVNAVTGTGGSFCLISSSIKWSHVGWPAASTVGASGPHPSYSGLEAPPTQAGQPWPCPRPRGHRPAVGSLAPLPWNLQCTAGPSRPVPGGGWTAKQLSVQWVGGAVGLRHHRVGGTLGERAGRAAARQGPRPGDPRTGPQGAAGCRGRVPQALTSSGAERSGWGPRGTWASGLSGTARNRFCGVWQRRRGGWGTEAQSTLRWGTPDSQGAGGSV